MNVLCLWALGAFADLEFNLLVFFEGAEAVALNLGVVNENICGSVSWSNETKALFSVEPLHSTLCHNKTLFLLKRMQYFQYFLEVRGRLELSAFVKRLERSQSNKILCERYVTLHWEKLRPSPSVSRILLKR